MKTTLFLGFGVLFWVSGAPTSIQTENSLYKVRRAPGVRKQQQSLLIHAVVQSDSSLVNGQQLICIKATDTRNSAF